MVETTRDEFFARRSWQRKQCPFCQESYYTKRGLPHCGSYWCSGGYTFTTIPAPKFYLEFGTCIARLREFFKEHGYPVQSPIAVVRNNERTLFASTAGQVYDDLIYGTVVESEPCQCVVLQPVIRLQSIGLVSSMEGISTSFVCAATEKWHASADEHYGVFDYWLDFFSSLGLHVGGFCLKTKQADNDWAGRTVTSEMIKINYSGLEIGVANFFLNIPQTNNTVATLSDIGVGVERLVWAINKSPSYFDSIGPLSCVIMLERVTLDAIRTATLMAASGVVPNHKNQGSKLRAMIGFVVDYAQHVNFYELVQYYYGQWVSLIDLPVLREHTYSVIWQEINRALNLKTNQELGIDEPFDQNHEEFLRRAVQKRTISISRVWNVTRKTI